ncbi:MAG: DEAD/DEAH box helicase, partial [Gemmatimonadetes bacterium]|nr:DEAD/DEAH box helicase [Gemmatimonadota bacterium]
MTVRKSAPGRGATKRASRSKAPAATIAAAPESTAAEEAAEATPPPAIGAVDGSLAAAEAATVQTSFADLGLSAPMLAALRDAGYVHPTPIQEQAVPLALKGRDLIGLAQTGTGKTAAFTIPIIERL